MNKKCIKKIVLKLKSEADIELNSSLAWENDNCIGVEEYSFNEEEVDSFLGEKAFSAGDVTHEVLDEMEGASSKDRFKMIIYYEVSKDEEIEIFLKSLKYVSVAIEDQNEKDWNEEWRKNYKEIIVNDNLKVIPSWEKKEDSKNNIYIYPGMGFGTGTHETTFLCLKLYEEINTPNNSTVLDMGCGSGILGIAAIKKNNSSVDFVDIDKDALENCLQNLELNEYQKYNKNQVLVIRERFTPEKYDLIFANILNFVLIKEKDILVNNLKKDGYLIVSGLLNNQTEEIINAYSSLECIKVESKGDWSAILFRGR